MKPSGRDYTTDPVLKRLDDSNHAALILACRLHARSPHAEDFQILDVHGGCEDNGNNQGHISDMRVSQAERDDTETRSTLTTGSALSRTKEKQAPTATPASRRNVKSVFYIDHQSQRAAEVTQTTTTEGQQQEGITEAETEGTMAHIDLKVNGSKALQRVRDSSMNETSGETSDGHSSTFDANGDDGFRNEPCPGPIVRIPTSGSGASLRFSMGWPS